MAIRQLKAIEEIGASHTLRQLAMIHKALKCATRTKMSGLHRKCLQHYMMELESSSVIKKYLITATDGKQYNTIHYNLQMIISVGFKVNNERLKSGGTILTEQYFEEQLQRVREIRLSERKFYQKITDIYATAIDYDVNAGATKRFFATVQNKLHWAIHGQTASEVIYTRADAEKEHMGLTTWKDPPHGKIQKFGFRLFGHCRGYGTSTYTYDYAGLGNTIEPFHTSN